MKAVEIIRNLLDLIDQEEQQEQQPVIVNINNSTAEQEPNHEEVIDDNVGVFVPPLQQKLELMKKAQGVESVYDEEPDQDDEVAVIKRIAGINPMNVIGDE